MARWDVLLDMTPLDTPSRYRGIGRYVVELARAIRELPDAARLGLRVGALTHVARAGACVDETLMYAGDPCVKPSRAQFGRYLAVRRAMLGTVLNAHRARFVHLAEAKGTPLFSSTPRIVTAHDLIPLLFPREYLGPLPLLERIERARNRHRYHSAARVIAISEATKNDLVRELDVTPDKIDVVPHGVDHERFRADADERDASLVEGALGFSGPFLLYVGAADARKNLDRLITSHARSKTARTMPLVIVGKLRDAHLGRLRALSQRAGRGADVRCVSYVQDAALPALYRRATAHVFPSLYEGFGLPVLEALACGSPTLTTSHGSLAEVAGDAALLVGGRDDDEMTAALDRIVEDAALRARLRVEGPARAALFTWSRCAQETLRAYKRAIDGAGEGAL